MTGLYPDVPGQRFAYDVDGTLIRYRYFDGTFASMPSAGPVMNDEDTTDFVELGAQTATPAFFTTGSLLGHYLTFVFPQVRDVVGYFIRGGVQAVTITTHRSDIIQTSTDTTDGSDGTWTTRVNANFPYATSAELPRSRDAIQPIAGATGIKGIRFHFAKDNTGGSGNDWFRIYMLHLYGSIVGATNGVRFWDPTLDQVLGKAHFDFGDLPQGTVWTKPFRLKNTSSQQANATVVSAESMAGSDAGMANGMTFSLDNAAFTASITVPTIAAGALSPVLYARRTVGAVEAAQIRNARIKAIVGSWT